MTDPRGPEFFNEVCAVTSDQTAEGSTMQFGEWTPTDNWFEGYTNMLQRGIDEGPQAPYPDTSKASESHSSQASAAEGSQAEKRGKGKGMSGLFNRARQNLKRWQNRTPEQQEANKAAQKRYRERKKGQLAQLQAEADALAAKVKNLEMVAEENRSLEHSNQSLEQQLSTAASPSTDSNQQPSSSGDWGSPEWTSFNEQFLQVVENLGRLLRERQVEPDAEDACVGPEVLQAVRELVLEAMDKCMQALNLGGLRLQSLIDAVETRKALATRGEGGSQDRWQRAVASLNLTEQQVHRGLQYRTHVLGLLEQLYEERAALNRRLVPLLADRASQPSPELPGSLAELKANLAAEQRAVSEQHFLVLRMLLSTTQGAWLLVHAYPLHCDCLAFLNALHASRPS